MSEVGFSSRDVAALVGRDHSTVLRCWNLWINEGRQTRNFSPGAPRITSERIDRRIRRMALNNRRATVSEIQASIGVDIHPMTSTSTINRRLLESGIGSRRPMTGPPLTLRHRTHRLQWCMERRNWTHEWRRIVFSNESRFCLWRSDGRIRIRRRPEERLHPDCIVERHVGRTPGIMIWGAISYNSRSPLVVVQGSLTAQNYINTILNPIAVPFLQANHGSIFQHDNARPHTANITTHFLRNYETLPWPTVSPDLSPIEHV